MQYLILLRFPEGAGPQEGTPELDAELARHDPSPFVTVNRTVGFAAGPEAGANAASALSGNAAERAVLERRRRTG